MSISIFTNKSLRPEVDDLKSALGKTFALWEEIKEYVNSKNSYFINEWNNPGPKYGWSFRIKDSNRAIIYLLPRKGFFKVALVFGKKAKETALESDVSSAIKTELRNAVVYAEGTGIRLDVKTKTIVKDIKKLIDIKILH